MKTNTLYILFIVVGTYFICTIDAQSCSGGGNHNNGNDCDENGNKYDYSFDGMPKPSNWRELKEYEYLLEAEGNVPTTSIKSRRQQHTEQQQDSDETPDDFASWEREMAEADNIREETFLESKLGRITLASFAAITFTFALLRLKKTAGEGEDAKDVNDTATKDEKKKSVKGSSSEEQISEGKSKDKKKKKVNKKKDEKEKKKESGKINTPTEKVNETKVKKEVSDEDEEDFVLVTKEETSSSKKKKKKKKKKAPKID